MPDSKTYGPYSQHPAPENKELAVGEMQGQADMFQETESKNRNKY
jgi:hypothetical protein